MLSRTHDVLLITRGEHLSAIQRDGLVLRGRIQDTFELPAVDAPGKGDKFDLILVTVKSYDTEIAGRICAGHLSEEGAMMTVQNGIGNAETLSSLVGGERVVTGITSMAAHLIGPGIVNYVAEGEITIGALGRGSESIELAERALRDAGIGTRLTDNILGVTWSKAIVNAAINTLTAIHGCRNGAIAENAELREEARGVCDEGSRVAEASGIQLDPYDVFAYVMDVAQKTADNKSSMRMDLGRRRRTEIDAICGRIIAAGTDRGVDTPVISRLYSLVKSLESDGQDFAHAVDRG